MSRPLHVLAKAALLTLVLPACVSYSRYEATALVAEKYRALAQSRRDSIETMYWDHLQTYRDNEALAHDKRLLSTELYATRTQYSQLQVANADVVSRYDRSLALSTFENEGNFSARQRLTEQALRREADASRAYRRTDEMMGLVEGLRGVNEDLSSMLEESEAEVDRYRAARDYVPAESRTFPSTPLSTAGGLLTFGELQPLLRYGTADVGLSDEGHQYVVRVSEAMCFPSKHAGMSTTGRAFTRDLAMILASRPGLRVLVHADSRQEGTHEQVIALERRQAAAVVDALATQGTHPAQLAALDDAQWAGRTTSEGTLSSGLSGEIVILLQPALSPGLSEAGGAR